MKFTMVVKSLNIVDITGEIKIYIYDSVLFRNGTRAHIM